MYVERESKHPVEERDRATVIDFASFNCANVSLFTWLKPDKSAAVCSFLFLQILNINVVYLWNKSLSELKSWLVTCPVMRCRAYYLRGDSPVKVIYFLLTETLMS